MRVRLLLVLLAVTIAACLMSQQRKSRLRHQAAAARLRFKSEPRYDPLAGARSGLLPFKGSLRVEDMTPEEHEELARMFTNEFQPALGRWCNAYRDHIPFRAEDIKLQQFKHRLGLSGAYDYTFVTDDGTTLSFSEDGGQARVSYVMTKTAAHELNSVPDGGRPPDLSVPIAKEDVMRMCEADTGKQYSLNETLIQPAGAASALQGGEFVSVGGGTNPWWNTANVQIVFDRNGKIVNYNAPLRTE